MTRADLNISFNTPPGRYTFHDLLAAYAAELTDLLDAGTDRRAARQRMFDHLLHTSGAAALLLRPGMPQLRLPPPAPGTTVDTLADRTAATA